MLDHYGLSHDLISPKTIKGKTKTIGLWDYEFKCDFKTLGAKRYIVKRGDDYEITIAGLNKKTTMEYMKKTHKNPFKFFENGMYIPATYTIDGNIYVGTGKNTHTYIDEARDGYVVDYRGKPYKYHVETCIHMEESDYTLSMATEFVDLLLRIERLEYN